MRNLPSEKNSINIMLMQTNKEYKIELKEKLIT